MIIYNKTTDRAGAYGKLDTPIKMIIEHESDLLTKKGGICSWLFNIEKSSRFGETIISESEFDIFRATPEGGGAQIDNIRETGRKFIEHIQFAKEFVITAEMIEDANWGIAQDAKRRAENFTRAYYKTMNKICESALIGADDRTVEYADARIDTTVADDYPLFSGYHTVKNNVGTKVENANYFYGDIFARTVGSERVISPEVFEESLAALSIKLRNLKDESCTPLGYTADTLIIPGNRPKLEMVIKKVCGSEHVPGGNYNDINLHYGNWNIVVLPNWQPKDNRIMIMSSEANKNLSGNMFFNRVPLSVTSWVDHHTENYIWNGRCRFGVGFGSYKHIILAVDTTATISNAKKLT